VYLRVRLGLGYFDARVPAPGDEPSGGSWLVSGSSHQEPTPLLSSVGDKGTGFGVEVV